MQITEPVINVKANSFHVEVNNYGSCLHNADVFFSPSVPGCDVKFVY